MSKTTLINNKIALKDFLNNVINEALTKKKVIVEQDSEEERALKTGDITLDDVIEKMNTIRAGKSFKDQEIKSAMQKYLDGLDDAEKTALFAFLKGIAQVVGGEVEGTKAVEPSDKPANVKMEKKPTGQKIHIKPNVVKKPAGPVKLPASSGGKAPEDTSPPVPIAPKKK
jgi:hypothetical protein